MRVILSRKGFDDENGGCPFCFSARYIFSNPDRWYSVKNFFSVPLIYLCSFSLICAMLFMAKASLWMIVCLHLHYATFRRLLPLFFKLFGMFCAWFLYSFQDPSHIIHVGSLRSLLIH